MTDLANPITTAERYARSTETSDLTLHAERRCDADVLLAAGAAAIGNPDLKMALSLYRMQVVRDRTGLQDVIDRAMGNLADRLKGRGLITATMRRALVVNTLQHWLNPTCSWCLGRAMVEMEGTGRLSLQECDACHGTGRTPLARVIPKRQLQHAEWLEAEWDRLVAAVVGEMARQLRPAMTP